MKMNRIVPAFLLLFLFISGCLLFRQPAGGTYYSFEYQGDVYEIIGVQSDQGETANFLVKRENRGVVFRAIDRNQEGTLEQVLSGNIELDRANRIYRAGIRMAQQEGRYNKIEKYREFLYRYGSVRLVVRSTIEKKETYVNLFVIYDNDGSVVGIYRDDGSDGILTGVEKGKAELENARELYKILLDRAREENRLDESYPDRFIITVDDPVELLRR